MPEELTKQAPGFYELPLTHSLPRTSVNGAADQLSLSLRYPWPCFQGRKQMKKGRVKHHKLGCSRCLFPTALLHVSISTAGKTLVLLCEQGNFSSCAAKAVSQHLPRQPSLLSLSLCLLGLLPPSTSNKSVCMSSQRTG